MPLCLSNGLEPNGRPCALSGQSAGRQRPLRIATANHLWPSDVHRSMAAGVSKVPQSRESLGRYSLPVSPALASSLPLDNVLRDIGDERDRAWCATRHTIANHFRARMYGSGAPQSSNRLANLKLPYVVLHSIFLEPELAGLSSFPARKHPQGNSATACTRPDDVTAASLWRCPAAANQFASACTSKGALHPVERPDSCKTLTGNIPGSIFLARFGSASIVFPAIKRREI